MEGIREVRVVCIKVHTPCPALLEFLDKWGGAVGGKVAQASQKELF